MKIHFYGKYPNPNFGDALNEWLWERLLPGQWDIDDGVRFSGIGTVLNSRLPAAKRWVVFTSGAGYGDPPPDFGTASWTVLAVRGPLTARALGLPPSTAVSDGALLLATLPEFAPLSEAERSGVVFVPHHYAENDGDWEAACTAAGVKYLSPRRDGREVIDQIRHARLVLADAMHAAIIADTMRVPWVPLVSSKQISTFKWLDWTQSMDVPYRFTRLPSLTVHAGIRSALMPVSGENHFVPSSDVDLALQDFTRHTLASRRAHAPAMRRLGRRVQRNALRLVRYPAMSRLLRGADRRQLDRTAAVIGAASHSSGFLSADRIYRQRLETLLERLSEVHAIAQRS